MGINLGVDVKSRKELIASSCDKLWSSKFRATNAHLFQLSDIGILGSIVGEVRWHEEAQYWFQVLSDGEVEYGRHIDCMFNYIPLIEKFIYNTYTGNLAITFESPVNDLQVEVSYEYLESRLKPKLYRSIDDL